MLLYGVAIASSQVAAHAGAFPVDNLRLFELLGLTSVGVLLTWLQTRDRFGQAGLVVLSSGGTVLVAAAVALSGGSASPLWMLYVFAAVFNGLYLPRRIARAALAEVIALSALPALIAGDQRHLLVQLLLATPIYAALTEVAVLLVNGLQRAAEDQAIAIEERAQLAEARRWSDQLEAISQVAQTLAGQTDLRAIATTIIDQTRQVIPYDSARVYVRDGNDLHPVAFRGTGEYAYETDHALRVRVGEGITGWVASQAQALIVDDARADPRGIPIPGEPAIEESMLVAPLIHDAAVNGVLVLIRRGRHQFTEPDLRLVVILAGQAGNAFAKAHLLAASQRRADTDGLTGLLNHRAVHEQLAVHLEAAAMNDEALSVVMVDAVGFKRVNDTFGHPVGDEMLQHLAQVLRAVCGPGDLIGRYGGDEFMLVLPGLTALEASRIAERVSGIAAREVVRPMGETGLVVRLRLSVGVATAPDDGTTVRELTAAADRRLYAARHRNDWNHPIADDIVSGGQRHPAPPVDYRGAGTGVEGPVLPH